MKTVYQIVIAILIFSLIMVCSIVMVNAAEPSAPASGPVRATGLRSSDLPPDIFNESCDGGASCPGRNFTDMPPAKHWAHLPIDWAVTHQITSGTSETTFSPGAGCTRAQAVTFLWRAAGSPEPQSSYCPFRDVSAGAYYRKAVIWAKEKGITSGTTATTFSPKQVCQRAQIITFLWRAKGSPAPHSATLPFVDVDAGAYYHDAVAWALEKKITNGTSAASFSPYAACIRAQIVTFLYHASRS